MILNHRSTIADNPAGIAQTRHMVMGKLGPAYFQDALWGNAHYFQEHGGSGLGAAFESMLYERQSIRTSSQAFNRHLMAVQDVINMCEYRQCQDSRDCVYGTLALCNWRTRVSLCKGGFHVYGGETLRPDYELSAFDVAKSLMPAFHDVPTLNKLTMGMLDLSHTTPEVLNGLASRYGTAQDLESMSKIIPWRITNEPQKLVHIVEGGIQLVCASQWVLLRRTVRLHEYTEVRNIDGRCCAITLATIEPGDWLIPTHYGRGFIVRRWGEAYTIIAKAYCPPELLPDDLELTAFMMWYDVDDLLIHLVGGLRGLDTDDIDPPSEEMIEHLNVRICAREHSSYGQLPSRRLAWPAHAYVSDSLGICEMMVKACYEDNN